MSKLVEVQATKEFASTYLNDIFFKMAVNRVLDAAPGFDLTHCKECEFFKDTWTSDDGKVYGYCPHMAIEHSENGYCHYGKEREDK